MDNSVFDLRNTIYRAIHFLEAVDPTVSSEILIFLFSGIAIIFCALIMLKSNRETVIRCYKTSPTHLTRKSDSKNKQAQGSKGVEAVLPHLKIKFPK